VVNTASVRVQFRESQSNRPRMKADRRGLRGNNITAPRPSFGLLDPLLSAFSRG